MSIGLRKAFVIALSVAVIASDTLWVEAANPYEDSSTGYHDASNNQPVALQTQIADTAQKIDWLSPLTFPVPPESNPVVDQAVGRALGGFLGGGGSRGIGFGGDSKRVRGLQKKKRLKLTRRPNYPLFDFTSPDGRDTIQVSGGMKDSQPQIFVRVKNSPDKSVPHLIVLENRQGLFLVPIIVKIVELWVKITLTVSWTKTYYRDGQMVGQDSGGWSTGWKERIGRFMQIITGPGIWQQLGIPPFNSAQGILADFKLPQGQPFEPHNWRLIIHITRRSRERGQITTQPFVANLDPGPDNSLIFTDGFESGDTSAWSSVLP